jgi:glucose/arabinose dehydrogenase
VSYGRQYDARQRMAEERAGRQRQDVESRTSRSLIYYWVPSIAPSGMMFYSGDLFPEWKGNLFVGAMVDQALVRLILKGERVCRGTAADGAQATRFAKCSRDPTAPSTRCQVRSC